MTFVNLKNKFRSFIDMLLVTFVVLLFGIEFMRFNDNIEFTTKWVEHAANMEEAEQARQRFFQKWIAAMKDADCHMTLFDTLEQIPIEGHNAPHE